MKIPCIVGLDPGTTVGCAILSIDGNLLHVFSEKNISLSRLIEKIVPYGHPIIVGCDKKQIPHFVYEFARKMGAIKIAPEEDIAVFEKTRLAKKHKTRNSHERDALASAVFARNAYAPFYRKVARFSKNHDSAHLKQELFSLSLKKRLSLRHALKMLQDKPVKRVRKPKRSSPEYGPLQNAYHSLREDYHTLQKEHAALQEKFYGLDEQYRKRSLKRVNDADASPAKTEYLLEKKDCNINLLSSRLKQAQIKIGLLTERVYTLRSCLLKNDSYVAMAVVKSLNEPIPDAPIVYVKEPNIYSSAGMRSLKDILIVLARKPNPKTRTLLPPFILGTNLNITVIGDLAIVSRSEFQKAKQDQETLFSLIDNYKESRRS